MGVVELEGRDRSGAGEDGGVVGVRLDVTVELFFGDPEILATARILAGWRNVRVTFGDMRVTRTSPDQFCGTFTLRMTPGGKALFDGEVGEARGEGCGGREVEFRRAIHERDGDGRREMNRSFF